MQALLRLAGGIDAVSRFFGWIAAWMVLLSCLISASNAASRYLFSLSSNAWLGSVADVLGDVSCSARPGC